MTADRCSATHVLFTSKSHHIHRKFFADRIVEAMNSSNAPIAKPARAAVAQQPTGAIQMLPTSAPAANRQQQPGEQKAMRIRGGGAAKDCFLGAIECFLCFECCKDCCECWADIICCPCEIVADCCC